MLRPKAPQTSFYGSYPYDRIISAFRYTKCRKVQVVFDGISEGITRNTRSTTNSTTLMANHAPTQVVATV